MSKKINQRNKIVLYLAAHPGATVREIFTELYINSPTKRLSELRQMGLIDEQKHDGENFKRYYLRGAV